MSVLLKVYQELVNLWDIFDLKAHSIMIYLWDIRSMIYFSDSFTRFPVFFDIFFLVGVKIILADSLKINHVSLIYLVDIIFLIVSYLPLRFNFQHNHNLILSYHLLSSQLDLFQLVFLINLKFIIDCFNQNEIKFKFNMYSADYFFK